MTFITQPTDEGQTQKCENCDVDLIARWTDYGGKWEDKLQWQTVEPRKAHYTKENECKDTTGEATTTTQESTVETPSVTIADNNPILESILSVLVEIKETLEK